MEERKVKGSMLLGFVRMIRANKDKDWNKYLKPEDWDTINSIVLPSKWYPFEVYQRTSIAAFYILGAGNLETARASGQLTAKYLFENTYKSVVQIKDPLRGLQQFVVTYGSFFNFTKIKLEKIDAHHAKIHHSYDPTDKGNNAYSHQLQGFLEMVLQMTSAKNAKVVISAKEWEGAPATVFDITWQ